MWPLKGIKIPQLLTKFDFNDSGDRRQQKGGRALRSSSKMETT